MSILIREEAPSDYRAVEELTREAFWDVYAPGCSEHLVIHLLRQSADFIPQLSLVAEEGGELVGHIAYTHAAILRENGGRLPVLCFGPISVHPDRQGQGIGSALIEKSFTIARQLGHQAVCILGDPRYYYRFGFRCGERYDIRTADGMYATALLAAELVPGALKNAAGRFVESEAFEGVTPEALETFDRTFPPREPGWKQSQEDFKLLVTLRFKA